MNPADMTIAQMFGLPADWLISMAPQGTVEWLEARKGCITGSRAKDACDYSDGLTEQQRIYVAAIRGGLTEAEAMARAGYKAPPKAAAVFEAIAGTLEPTPSAVALTYARETALGRVCPSWDRDMYETHAMRQGKEQEAFARRAYEIRTGFMVDAAGFVCTPDRKIGVSIDGLVLDVPKERGGIEVKTLVGSNVIFDVLIHGDVSEYRHQCQLNIWAWCLDWIDLCLWAPDMEGDARLTIVRIERDQDFIDDMLEKLARFDRLVERCVQQLRDFQAGVTPFNAEQLQTPPWDAAPSVSPAAPATSTAPAPAPAPAPSPAPAALAVADF